VERALDHGGADAHVPVAVVVAGEPADSASDPETAWAVLEVLGDLVCAVAEIADW
jgi:hypothetical protein